MESRRNFITKSLLALGSTAAITNTIVANERISTNVARIGIKKDAVILFQGDSITDAGRNKENMEPNVANAFGNGYAMLAASELLNSHASKNLSIFNKGISGNRVPDLINRWEKDTFSLNPDILSILIGVNDFWRTKDSGAQNSPAQFKQQYQQLLEQTLQKHPHVQLIIGEPFAVKNVKHVTDDWYPDFPNYQQVTKEIAKEFKAVFIPYQSIFDKAEKHAPGSYWTTDGVHTTLAGANLMAQAWLNAFK